MNVETSEVCKSYKPVNVVKLQNNTPKAKRSPKTKNMKVTKGPLNATSKGDSKKRKAGNSGESPEQKKLNSEIKNKKDDANKENKSEDDLDTMGLRELLKLSMQQNALSLGSIDKKLDDFRAEFRTENKKLREQLKDLKATQQVVRLVIVRINERLFEINLEVG